MADRGLEMDADVRGEAVIVALRGRLDSPHEQDLIVEVKSLLKHGIRRVVIDCSRLDYLSSRGVSAFIAVLDDLRAKGGDLKLVGVGREGRLILDRLGISKIVHHLDSVDEALRAFGTPIEEFMGAQGIDTFVAGPRDALFHASGCPDVPKVAVLRTYHSKKDARESGKKPCPRCCEAWFLKS
jgi:anti-sigma B factor antagonist